MINQIAGAIASFADDVCTALIRGCAPPVTLVVLLVVSCAIGYGENGIYAYIAGVPMWTHWSSFLLLGMLTFFLPALLWWARRKMAAAKAK